MHDLNKRTAPPRVLVIDVGGSHVKLRNSGDGRRLKFKSGPKMTPSKMVKETRALVSEWDFEVVSIGFPGPVVHGKAAAEPNNLGSGWTRFDFEKAFGKPVQLINDAAMQALGSYTQGRMLFLGLGTGLGSALIVDGVLVPLEVGEIRYSKHRTLEDVLGKCGLKKSGRQKWESHVHAAVANLRKAFVADHVVIGGGNVKKLKLLPEGARRGSNRYAFRGGARLWQSELAGARSKKHPVIIT